MKIGTAARLQELNKALDAVKSLMLQDRQQLARAPAWYDSNMPTGRLDRRKRITAMKLRRSEKRLRLNRKVYLELKREIRRVAERRADWRLCKKRALRWINAVEDARTLIRTLKRDPANKVLMERVRYSVRDLKAVLSYRNRQPTGKFRTLAQIKQTPRVAESKLQRIVEDILYTVCTGPADSPQDEVIGTTDANVGVMLPLHLETLFPTATGGRRQLWLRVTPDNIWVNRFNPKATPIEVEAYRQFVKQIPMALDDPDDMAPLWAQLCDAVGAERAAWLRQHIRINNRLPEGEQDIFEPNSTVDEAPVSHIEGFPPRLEVWVNLNNGTTRQIHSLDIKRDQLHMDLVAPSEAGGKPAWWHDWEAAKAVGLGAEIDLGAIQPDEIEALYVVGISDKSPDTLLKAKEQAGELAVMPLGTATNSVSGETAGVNQSYADWFDVANTSLGDGGYATANLGLALTGNSGLFRALINGDYDHYNPNQAMVRSLWQALWGHCLRHILDMGDKTTDLGLWAANNLIPEGPMPPLQVGSNPYGILPVTSLEQWRPDDQDPRIEQQLLQKLIKARQQLSVAAEQEGTVEGADTEGLMELLGRTAHSSAYRYRPFVSLDFLYRAIFELGGVVDYNDLLQVWREQADSLNAFSFEPSRKYLTLGFPSKLRLPLVTPDNTPGVELSDWLQRLRGVHESSMADPRKSRELFNPLPNSLLFRLLLQNKLQQAAEVVRQSSSQKVEPGLEPVVTGSANFTNLASNVHQFNPAGMRDVSEYSLYDFMSSAINRLAEEPHDVLERVFRSCLDTAAYRIDPWVNGIAWRRLTQLQQQSQTRYKLCAYGWVDKPDKGEPGLTKGGLLHAPGDSQLMTSVVLRDKALRETDGLWNINIESDSVRLASWFAKEVRIGANISEVCGREVERILATKSQVEQARKDFPLREEHDGRRTCDGLAFLEAFDPDAQVNNLDSSVINALVEVQRALDTYADLLVADAVHQVVSGRGEAASESMDAAAGLGKPPELDVIKTKRSARGVSTTVLFALPAVEEPELDPALTQNPKELADASVFSYLNRVLGESNDPRWSCLIEDINGDLIARNLNEINLSPCDAATLDTGKLKMLLLGAVENSLQVLEEQSPLLHSHAQLRMLIAAMGARPALQQDVNAVFGQESNITQAEILRKRINSLLSAADALLIAIQAAGSDEEKRTQLLHASRWGIVADYDAGIDTQLQLVQQGLVERINSVDKSKLDSHSFDQCARVLAELATADGQYPITLPYETSSLEKISTNPDTDMPEDDDWLSTMAAIQRPLARLEAWQLERLVAGEGILEQWCNRVGDIWQTQVKTSDDGEPLGSHLTMAYGSPDAFSGLPQQKVAFSVIGHWGESVPLQEHNTAAAFGFNAPSARAPQAILLAAPPVNGQLLNNRQLVQILAETRQTLRARMVSPESLSAYAAALPTTVFSSTGSTAVKLTPEPVGNGG
ncbi:MAG: hypothetical protein RPU34_07645 [Candidatus Sedimenticola sp. (ex Thyasira tokunagai)]